MSRASCAGWHRPACLCRYRCRSAAVRPPRPGPSRAGALAAAGGSRGSVAGGGRRAGVQRDLAGRRHRVGQDGGLSRGGGGVPAAGPAGAGAAAGDRAVVAVAGAVHGRFGVAPAVWHSDLASRTRRVTWRAVAEGGAPVVVGARSALFLPFPDLGLIVVDEEHETAFKQEDGVVYHARDMAVVRARLSQAPAVLVSATPSWRRSRMSSRGAIAGSRSRRGTAGPSCRRWRRSTCATRRRSAGGSFRRC